MKTALYPGSFDPFTLGHLDIVKKTVNLFDKLYIGVFVNTSKKYMFDLESRLDMIKSACNEIKNVEVVAFEGLLYKFVAKEGIDVVVRGLRDGADFDSEIKFYYANFRLYDKINMMFVPSSPEYIGISSSLVKELLTFGEDISKLVPKVINDKIMEVQYESGR